MNRLTLHTSIRDIGPHRLAVGATKDDQNRVVFHYEDAGHKLTLDLGNADISLLVPDALPADWQRGDTLLLTLEKAE